MYSLKITIRDFAVDMSLLTVDEVGGRSKYRCTIKSSSVHSRGKVAHFTYNAPRAFFSASPRARSARYASIRAGLEVNTAM